MPLTELSNTEVYAAETTSNNTSLIISNSTSTAPTRDGVAYSSHLVQVKADNITGYNLTIASDVANLTNGTTTVTGVGTNVLGSNIANLSGNRWGYGWANKDTADASMQYNSFPTTGGTATTLESNSSVSSIDFTKKLAFAAKFDQDATAGHYKANVTLNLAITPKTVTGDYSIIYNLNGGTGGPSNMGVDTTDTSYIYTIPTAIPTKTNYAFAGWSDDNSSYTKYQPGNVVNLNTTNSNITLSAVWVISLDAMTTMQQMSPAACASAAIGAEKTLVDTRDNGVSSYLVRKLTDGNCWMTTNLTLDLSKAGVATVAESDNLTSAYPSDALTNRWETTSATAPNQWEDSGTIAQFSKAPQKTYYGTGSYKSSYGYYYSSNAATAGARTNHSSICPKNWHLARGGASGDFQTLYNKNASAASWTTDNGINGRWLGAASANAGGAFFPAAGNVETGGLNNAGTFGYYWGSGDSYYYMYFYNSSMQPSHDNSVQRNYGFSVRCVAYSEPDITRISTMQEMTSAVCARSTVGAANILTDTRDGNVYSVRKLTDGNCWMVDNLKLDLGSVTLTPDNSDITSKYTAGTATNADSTWKDTNTLAQFSTNGKGSTSYNSDYGYYYSWCAATTGTCSGATFAGTIATSSICPKGWKLPKGNSDGDFQALYNKNTSTGWAYVNSIYGRWLGATSANAGGAFFPAAGFVNSDGLNGVSSGGRYWSRTIADNGYVSTLDFSNSYIYPANDNAKYFGFSVRCIAYSS